MVDPVGYHDAIGSANPFDRHGRPCLGRNSESDMVVGTDASRRDRAKGRSDRWTSVALPSDLRGDSGAPYSSMNLASRGCQPMDRDKRPLRSEEHTSELQSLMRISYAVFCLKKKTQSHSALQ